MSPASTSLYDLVVKNAKEISRPSENWHIHKGANFLSFVHIDNQGIGIDKIVRIKKDETHPEILIMGKKISEPSEKQLNKFEEIGSLLKKVEELRLCPGTGVNGTRDPNCSSYIPPPCKYMRCKHCAEMKRKVAKGIRRRFASEFKKARHKKIKNNKIRNLSKKIVTRNKKVRIIGLFQVQGNGAY